MTIAVPLETNANKLSVVLGPVHSTQSHYPVSYRPPIPPSPITQLPESTVSTDFQLFTVQIFLYGEIVPGWRIVQPLLVTLKQDEDGYYIVSGDQFAVYGDDVTRVKALQDYFESLIEYYQLLAARVEEHPPTKVLFRRLQQYLHPITE